MELKAVKGFTKSQLKHFNSENPEYQEAILHALKRKPIHKVLKCGLLLDVGYAYDMGCLGFYATLARPGENKNQVLWKSKWYYGDDGFLDGEEPKSWIVQDALDRLRDEISEDEEEHILKRILS